MRREQAYSRVGDLRLFFDTTARVISMCEHMQAAAFICTCELSCNGEKPPELMLLLVEANTLQHFNILQPMCQILNMLQERLLSEKLSMLANNQLQHRCSPTCKVL